jgi:hypothetical protein
MLGGYLAGSFPPFLYPSAPIFKPFFRLYFHHEAEQNKTKEMLYCCWATSTHTPLDSLPSSASGAGLLTAHA